MLSTALKVEIGPGKERIGKDWMTVGVNDDVDEQCLWGIRPLPFEDCEVDEIYASHVIEHIPWYRTQEAFNEAFRVLNHGGTIELHTIDFGKVVELYLAKDAGDWSDRPEVVDNPILWAASRIFSHGESYGDVQWHKALFDKEYLYRLLVKAGFTSIKDVKEPRGPEKHGVASIGVRAVKP